MKITLKDMIRVSLFSGLMVVGAFIKIPLPFLPVTLQGFFCALAGILLGARLGLLSQLIYILMGLLGLPVFSSGGGITYILNLSFGYIIGFALAAFVIGWLSERLGQVNFKNALISLYSGLTVMYLCGLGYAYLLSVLYLNKPNAAFVSMVIVPFIIKDIVLFTAAGVVVSRTSQLVKKQVLNKA